jgi:hypothetical protein
MSLVKVIEVIAESGESWEDAAAHALMHASKTVRGIRTLYVQEMQAIVENNKIAKYRVNAKITFVLEDED